MNGYMTRLAILIALVPMIAHGASIAKIQKIKEFDALLSRNNYVVAEFYNPGCPVCRAFDRDGTFPALAKKYPNIRFVKVSTGRPTELYDKYNNGGNTPTFVFFEGGQEVGREEGRFGQGIFKKHFQKYFGIE